MPDEEKFVKVTINMPKSYHRKLKAIAALKDRGISAYIFECLKEVALCEEDSNSLAAYTALLDNPIEPNATLKKSPAKKR